MSDEILVERRDGIATVTLNRPEQMNAVNYEMWLEVARILHGLDGDRQVRALVLTGAGNQAFSAGADIKDFQEHRSNPRQAREYTRAVERAMDALAQMSKPSVVLIKGNCVGGGCEFSLAADLRIAADNSRFGVPIARLGILTGYGEMQRLVRAVGPGNTMYLLMTARLVNAQEALRMGLVNQVVPLEEIEEYTYALARDIAENAPFSHAGHKRIMKIVLENPALRDLTEEEQDLPFAVFDSQDFKEGARAFIEKRKPHFTGQ